MVIMCNLPRRINSIKSKWILPVSLSPESILWPIMMITAIWFILWKPATKKQTYRVKTPTTVKMDIFQYALTFFYPVLWLLNNSCNATYQWLSIMTGSSPKCTLRSHSLVCTKNNWFIVVIGPILNKELKFIFQSDRSDRTCVYR